MSKLRREYVTRQVWLHNSLFGGHRMAHEFVKRVQYAETTSIEARACARQIEVLLDQLGQQLTKRIDPPSAFQKELP